MHLCSFPFARWCLIRIIVGSGLWEEVQVIIIVIESVKSSPQPAAFGLWEKLNIILEGGPSKHWYTSCDASDMNLITTYSVMDEVNSSTTAFSASELSCKR